ncbi:sensor box histidine kinase [Natronomonas pharaonis DSM 2160]|uniref:Sensor box histidine kinase n=1 Tax=Natronomonas pharaonis (strain ATCC 35678 / DSM 2160 / CIP 103997 / JCM 8858 / NBRC 14720 / NCIMB 2260 / Gabara) TaxID=348780 RepID=A0A1U7EVE8_NATPD|nr:PAS domain S-box protein [Natronomonas pharaonis]CAI48993.2 sensor box histidine kinase [Natronomonas pharaonis DSM 2160]
MSGGLADTADGIDPEVAETTVQLLVDDDERRRRLDDVLGKRYRILADEATPATEADLHVVDSAALETLQDQLARLTRRDQPVFRPVLLLCQSGCRCDVAEEALHEDETETDEPPVVDDVIRPSLDDVLLRRRIRTLVVRRRQSRRLESKVSTLRQRERRLRSFKRAVERSGHSIMITDTEGVIRYVNPAFEGITGYSEAEAVGEKPSLLQSGEHDETFYRSLWTTISDGDVWESQVINERKDGEQYVVDQTIAPITDGDRIEGYVSVNSDITDRVTRERELRSRERELDRLRQILTRVLRHNIRNDATVFTGYGELIAENADEPYASMAEGIVETAESLSKTTEKARELSRLVERDPTPTAHDLSSLLRSTAEEVQTEFPEVDITVDVDDDLSVLGTEELPRVFHALLENAAAHNDASDPEVRLRTVAGDPVLVVIEDNGPGIPETEVKSLDSREETPLQHSDGTGLWLAGWILDRSDGTLRFDDHDDGTRIEIELLRP